jgi:sugar O-acyltransferase (sialic acid O-acetyltransferase NeuD family)
MARALFIIGTGGLAREMAQLAAQVARVRSAWDFRGFISAGVEEVGRDLGWGVVAGDDSWLLGSGIQADVLAGIGHPRMRSNALIRYVEEGSRFGFPNLIHPSVELDVRWVELGRGNVVTTGCVLTTDVAIGDFNLLNWHVTVGHDVEIGDFDVVNPGASISGGVKLGDRVLVGTGARILGGLAVGSDATVGAGAVVTHDVADSMRVIGVPARPMERASDR